MTTTTSDPMPFWMTGDEDHDDPRFNRAGTAALGLYTRGGSWCMRQARGRQRGPLPDAWVLPKWVVRGWRGERQAAALVAEEIFNDLGEGYEYAWVRPENTPARVFGNRKKETVRKAHQRRDEPPCPTGTYTRDTEPDSPW